MTEIAYSSIGQDSTAPVKLYSLKLSDLKGLVGIHYIFRDECRKNRLNIIYEFYSNEGIVNEFYKPFRFAQRNSAEEVCK
jgi:hypothetical protein